MAVWSHSTGLLPTFLPHLIELTPCAMFPSVWRGGWMLSIPNMGETGWSWSPVLCQGSYRRVGLVQPRHLSVIFLPSSLKCASWPVRVTVAHPIRWRWTKTCFMPSDISSMHWGRGRLSYRMWLIYLFIYLRWILAASRVFPLRDNSGGSRCIHLLPWWCAHSFCWRLSTSISPFLLSAWWKCLQVLQS